MERRLRGVDILAMIFATLCILEAVAGLLLQPTYLRMFAEFGSTLPVFTRIMLSPIPLIVAGFLPMVLVVEGMLRGRSEVGQVARCALAIAAMAGMLVSFLVAMYLPMLELSGQIR
jgi:type II secretory pathway component PulF